MWNEDMQYIEAGSFWNVIENVYVDGWKIFIHIDYFFIGQGGCWRGGY
jgi:hypothetical protein